MPDRYHILKGEKRTTITVDTIISNLMALKLGYTPETTKAYSAVQKWIQKKFDEYNDPKRIFVSQWIREKAIFELLDTKISNRYWDWVDTTL
jgi:hypothetical protein